MSKSIITIRALIYLVLIVSISYGIAYTINYIVPPPDQQINYK